MARPLPPDLPAPVDDGAADRLRGAALPSVALPVTDGSVVRLDEMGPGRTVVYVYPLTGRDDVELPEGWDALPGARGCTNEACDFRDHHADLLAAGAGAVYGLSSQTTEYQAELVERLGLPFGLLADPDLLLADEPGLPVLTAGGRTLYRRQTLVVLRGRIEHVFYPVFPPDTHAGDVLAWLAAR